VDGIEGGDGGSSEVVPEELEVDLIGDPPIVVQIDHLEPAVQQFLTCLHLYVFEDVVDGVSEFLTTHDSLGALGVHLLSVPTLDGHFSEVLLGAEVGELVVGDLSVVVAVVPEDILGHIFQFVLVFLQQAHQGFLNLFLAELFVLVGIIGDE
jgi:hypothetical protein